MIRHIRKAIWDVSSQIDHFRGKERLVGLVARPRNQGTVRIVREGVNWSVQGHDLNEFAIAARKTHTPKVSRILSEEIESHGHKVLWDIGANIGGIALPLLAKHPNLEVIMFEPSADVAGRLFRNFALNPEIARRARLLNIALSDTDGLANFYTSAETFNSGTGGLAKSDNRFSVALEVQAFKGDTLIAKVIVPVPDIIKIDVEGFELSVFEGLEQTLRTHGPSLLFEHSTYRFVERNRPFDEVVGYLRSISYEVFCIDTNSVVTNSELSKNADFIARKL